MLVTTDIALTVIDLARAERFADIEALFAPSLRAVVSADTMRAAWAAERARIGADWTIGAATTEPAGPGLRRVEVLVTGERDGHTVIVTVGDDGRLHGLRIAPPGGTTWRPPRYAKPRRFHEHEVTVGSGPLTVGGTMTLPRRRGPVPGVVLVGGGGPFDRDGTAGPDKPLKDLAWGLASRGIAVLRMDKTTHTHPEIASAPAPTRTRPSRRSPGRRRSPTTRA